MLARSASATMVVPAATGRDERHFDALPDTGEALCLLGKLSTGACRFGPAPARTPLVLYGAGSMGRLARAHLNAVGVEVEAIVDRDAGRLRMDPFWRGEVLLTPEEAPDSLKRDALLAVSVATAPFVPLEAGLRAAGWVSVAPFYDVAETFRDRHPLSNGWFAAPLDPQGFGCAADVLARWHDDVSRAHHLQFLAWRRLREEWTFAGAPVSLDDRFFIPEVAGCLDDDEIFVDCGAHHGSVTWAFLARTGGRFACVVALEPDAGSRHAFMRAMDALDPGVSSRIVLLPHALDSGGRERTFHDGLGYASQLAETGRRKVQTCTLDSLGLSPSFVKLHLEGGELDALRGALATLRAHRPIVAVTTYHNDDGIWRTPHFLMEHLSGYRFLMRLHSWCGTGAVVYAIPVEQGDAHDVARSPVVRGKVACSHDLPREARRS